MSLKLPLLQITSSLITFLLYMFIPKIYTNYSKNNVINIKLDFSLSNDTFYDIQKLNLFQQINILNHLFIINNITPIIENINKTKDKNIKNIYEKIKKENNNELIIYPVMFNNNIFNINNINNLHNIYTINNIYNISNIIYDIYCFCLDYNAIYIILKNESTIFEYGLFKYMLNILTINKIYILNNSYLDDKLSFFLDINLTNIK